MTTTQKFENKDVYSQYKTAQEESSKNNSSENIVYDLKSDDNAMTLVFTMTIKNLDINNAETEEQKENLKASAILQALEKSNYTCKVDGIDRDKLK